MSNGNGSNQVVQKLWNFCNVLRDDGLSYQDYLEQLVTLLFLKMADERTELTGAENPIPAGYRWSDLAAPRGAGRHRQKRCAPPSVVLDGAHQLESRSLVQFLAAAAEDSARD